MPSPSAVFQIHRIVRRSHARIPGVLGLRAGATLMLGTACLIACVCRSDASEPAWRISAGVASPGDYAYRTQTYSFGTSQMRADPLRAGFMSLGRRLEPRVDLVLEAGYRAYADNIGLVRIPELPEPSARLDVTLWPVLLGARYRPLGATNRPLHPYVQALQGIVAAHWTEASYDAEPGVRLDSFTRVVPGFELGLGMEGRWGHIQLDGGFRYLRAAGFGEHQLGKWSSGAFDGPHHWSSVASLGWTW